MLDGKTKKIAVPVDDPFAFLEDQEIEDFSEFSQPQPPVQKTEEPTVVETPTSQLPETAPTKQVPEESEDDFVLPWEGEEEDFLNKPQKITQKLEEEEPQEIPEEDWSRPEWLPQKDYEFPKEVIQKFKFETFELPEPELTDIRNIDNAIRYLQTLDNDRIPDILELLTNARNSIGSLDDMVAAQMVGTTIIHLKTLSNKASEIFSDNETVESVQKAVDVILKDLGTSTSKLSTKAQGKIGKIIDKNIDPIKQKPREFTSKYLPEGFKNKRQRAVQLSRDRGLTESEAMKAVEKEWNRAGAIVEMHAQNQPLDKKNLYKEEFIGQLLGGASFDDAEDFIIKLINQGNTNESVFKNVNTDKFDEDRMMSMAGELASSSLSQELMEDEDLELSEEDALKIAQNVERFGKNARNVLAYINYIDSIEPGLAINQEAKKLGQDSYDTMIALARQIMLASPDVLESSKEFMYIYALQNNIRDLAKNDKYELGGSSDDEFIAVQKGKELSEQKEEMLEQGPKPGSGEGSTAGIPRNKEKAQKAREQYRKRLKEVGVDPSELARQRREKRLQDPDYAAKYTERRKIRNGEYPKTKSETARWVNLALNRIRGKETNDPLKIESEVNSIKSYNRKRLKSFAEKIKSSWMDPSDVESIERDIIAHTIDKMSEALNALKKEDNINQYVIDVFEKHIKDIPNIYVQNKDSIKDIQRREKKSDRIYELMSLSKLFSQAS